MNCVQEQLKSRFEVVVTSYGRNKNLDAEIKTKNANNSPSYRLINILSVKRSSNLLRSLS